MNNESVKKLYNKNEKFEKLVQLSKQNLIC